MFRALTTRISGVLRSPITQKIQPAVAMKVVRAAHGEMDESLDQRYEEYFSRSEIDGWEIRKAMNDLLGMDLVPEPKVIIAALKACRRVNDYALAVRWLEGCKEKCGDKKAEIYPYLLENIKPTLQELGVLTPEEMGYEYPELALKTVYE